MKAHRTDAELRGALYFFRETSARARVLLIVRRCDAEYVRSVRDDVLRTNVGLR